MRYVAYLLAFCDSLSYVQNPISFRNSRIQGHSDVISTFFAQPGMFPARHGGTQIVGWFISWQMPQTTDDDLGYPCDSGFFLGGYPELFCCGMEKMGYPENGKIYRNTPKISWENPWFPLDVPFNESMWGHCRGVGGVGGGAARAAERSDGLSAERWRGGASCGLVGGGWIVGWFDDGWMVGWWFWTVRKVWLVKDLQKEMEVGQIRIQNGQE